MVDVIDHRLPGDGVLDSKGPLSPPNTLAEVNKKVKHAVAGQKKKRDSSFLHTHREGEYEGAGLQD